MQTKRQQEIALVLILTCLIGIFSFISFSLGMINLINTNDAQMLLNKRKELNEILKRKEEILKQLYKEISKLKKDISRSKNYNVSHEKEIDAINKKIDEYKSKIKKIEKDIVSLQQKISNIQKNYIDVGSLIGGSFEMENPLYVECINKEIIIQPEGIKISLEQIDKDFENIIKNENCIVFLVRPNGFESFIRAREIVKKNKNIKYGYEPIDSSWKLKYPRR